MTEHSAVRLAAMRRQGLRYVGARRDVDLFSEACQFACSEAFPALNEGREPWVLGIIFDRGADKDHGSGKRIDAPNGYNGEPVYWLRKVTWTASVSPPNRGAAQR